MAPAVRVVPADTHIYFLPGGLVNTGSIGTECQHGDTQFWNLPHVPDQRSSRCHCYSHSSVHERCNVTQG